MAHPMTQRRHNRCRNITAQNPSQTSPYSAEYCPRSGEAASREVELERGDDDELKGCHHGRLHGDQHSVPLGGDHSSAIWIQPVAREQQSMGKSWLVVEKYDCACVPSFAFPLKSILAGAQTTIPDPTIHDTIPVVDLSCSSTQPHQIENVSGSLTVHAAILVDLRTSFVLFCLPLMHHDCIVPLWCADALGTVASRTWRYSSR
jgi:hypothetical protein